MQKILNPFFKLVGISFLLLAKLKVALRGYVTPKPFTTREWERCAKYDIKVVDNWLGHLTDYTHGKIASVAGMSVCEFGPGSDLGAGLCLLAKGAAHYVAVDVNNNAATAPQEIYEALFAIFPSLGDADSDSLRKQLRMTQNGAGKRLQFVWSPEFDFTSKIPHDSVDLVFSQAAFEHFDDIDRFFKDLDLVAKPGAILIAEVDLRTHSRWIRDKDELNIFRYGDRLYNLLRCSGSPNRIRPYQYREALEKCGWIKVVTKPLTVMDKKRFAVVRHSLARRFRDDRNEMDQLSIVLCATKRFK